MDGMSMVQPDKDMLAPGNALPWDIVDSSGRILLPKGTPVSDPVQAKQLWTRGYFHEVDPEPEPPPKIATSSWRTRPRDPETAAPRFFQAVMRLSWQLEETYCDLLTGRPGRITERLGEYAKALQAQIAKDSDAFLASVELSETGRYGTIHAIHSATLCDLVAQSMGMAPEQRRILICAALTRDVGFLELQEELDLQNEPLTNEQRTKVKCHPLESAKILRESGVENPDWLAAVEQHHERLNGTGYPKALPDDRICAAARLMGITDAYSAMTKPRAYRAALQGPTALHSLFQTRGSLVDAEITQRFIRVLGMYPPGVLVRLSTQEMAVVTRRTANLKFPEVRVVADAEGKLQAIYASRELSEGGASIQEILPRSLAIRSRLNHRQLWGEGPAVLRR
jgi:hypothetical protein